MPTIHTSNAHTPPMIYIKVTHSPGCTLPAFLRERVRYRELHLRAALPLPAHASNRGNCLGTYGKPDQQHKYPQISAYLLLGQTHYCPCMSSILSTRWELHVQKTRTFTLTRHVYCFTQTPYNPLPQYLKNFRIL